MKMNKVCISMKKNLLQIENGLFSNEKSWIQVDFTIHKESGEAIGIERNKIKKDKLVPRNSSRF